MNNKHKSETELSSTAYALIESFYLIEKARVAAVNKGKRRRLSKEKCADLYFAGSHIIWIIRKSKDQPAIKKIEKLIKEFKDSFN